MDPKQINAEPSSLTKDEASRKDHSLKIASPAAFTRWLAFGLWALVSLLLFAKPLYALVQLAERDDTSSHILLIPFICAWLLYSERNESQREYRFPIWPALAFFLPSLLIAFGAGQCAFCSPKDRLSAYILSLVFLLIAGFVFILGTAKAKTSGFTLAFLIFAIPIPDFILDKIIYGLQAGSAAVAEVFFDLSGVPVLREGFVFRLPKMSIEVAKECSGIRSSLALLILALLVAHFSFRPIWKKFLFILAGLCMMLVKNGIRIATLTLLANYVDPDFLYGRLHRQGGVVFFLIGLVLLVPVYWYLRKGEASSVVVAGAQKAH
jgi:exosortase